MDLKALISLILLLLPTHCKPNNNSSNSSNNNNNLHKISTRLDSMGILKGRMYREFQCLVCLVHTM